MRSGKLILFISIGILCVIGLVVFSPKPPLLQNISFSQAIYDKQHHLLRLTLSQDQKYRLYTPLSQISPLVIEATLLQEDQYFYQHPGINPVALAKAIWRTYYTGDRRVGASTITMQVARMRFGINSKHVLGKIEQMLDALRLELFYSKDQILEAYLNLASYGGNIEGAGAASLIYFSKPAQQLSLPEALTLVVIPQNPLERGPRSSLPHLIPHPNPNPLPGGEGIGNSLCRSDQGAPATDPTYHTSHVGSASLEPTYKDGCSLLISRHQLYLRWLTKHPQDADKKALVALPLQTNSTQQIPFLAPHFVDQLLLSQDTSANTVTTLNLKLQKITENITRQYIKQKSNIGISNAAVMLVDTRNMEVKALLGSADFFDTDIAGQVNGTLARRSPGSTLKPFIYALAIDQGLIHPYTVLKDAPTRFGSYNPENFDKDFVGPIKAKQALELSRNIPAIYLAAQLGQPTLYQFLQQAEVAELKPEKNYGLSLVLGGAEVTMQELVTLYATLANGGVWKPLRTQTTEPIVAGKRLLSPEAAFLTLDMLKDTARPQTIFVPAIKNNRVPVFWKTGTSSGFRDAWTVGVFGPYVLAVWVGNFDATSNPAFVGKDAAAPLFFNLADAIETQTGPLPNVLPDPKKLHLVQTEVCEASGMLPTRACQNKVKTWFIPGKSPIKTDTVFREIAIDTKTGLRACRFDNNVIFAVYEFWPSDLLKIFQQAGVQRRTPPPYDAGCDLNAQATNGQAPQITSPQSAIVYTINLNKNNQQTNIPFSAIGDADIKTFYWFVNEAYIGQSPRDKILFWAAKPGNYIVRVVDDRGRSNVVKVRVQTAT